MATAREPFTEADIAKIQTIFESMPSYNKENGAVDFSEYGNFLEQINYPHTPEQLKFYLKLVYEARKVNVVYWKDVYRYARAQHDIHLLLVEYAITFDLDEDGYISDKEFQVVVETLKLHEPINFGENGAKSYQEFLKEADSNKDGKVSIIEFADYLRKYLSNI